MRMQRIFSVVFMLLLVSLSGCSWSEDEDPETGGTIGGDGDVGDDGVLDGNETDLGGDEVPDAGLDVDLVSVPDGIKAGQEATFTWTIASSEPNGTVVETGIVWSEREIANETAPGSLDDKVVVSENATAPGSYETNVTFSAAGDFFIRAYALENETVTWSDLMNVTVGVELKVTEVGISNGAIANAASFSPSAVTIKVGEAVAWKNNDNDPHQVVSASGSVIDTGEIKAGETSEPVVFDTAGSYEYECKMHEGFGVQHKGAVTVEA